MRTFALYPIAQHWWSSADYGAVLDVMQQLKPKRVLEFGPGSSTLALIEGGAEQIDGCEDNPVWMEVHRKNLACRFPAVVQLHAYHWGDPLIIPALEGRTYDLALIDGPVATPHRAAVLAYALPRSTAVLMPTEDDGRTHKSLLRPIILALASQTHRHVTFMETGPFAGGFALVTPC